MNVKGLVPLQEDLTKEELRLNILRGHETMFRVDKKLEMGASLELGEWGSLNSDGTVGRPSTTSEANTYLVFCGTERSDVHATGAVTLIMNSGVIAKSARYKADSYQVGDALTAKDHGAGSAMLGKAVNGEYVHARVTEVGSGYLVFEVVAAPFKKA